MTSDILRFILGTFIDTCFCDRRCQRRGAEQTRDSVADGRAEAQINRSLSAPDALTIQINYRV
eukprot:6207472-Pleurochrysis_carterae.AAC.7